MQRILVILWRESLSWGQIYRQVVILRIIFSAWRRQWRTLLTLLRRLVTWNLWRSARMLPSGKYMISENVLMF